MSINLKIVGLWLALTVALVSMRTPSLLSALLNNAGSIALLPEWTRVGDSSALPHCEQWLPQSDASVYIDAAAGLDPLNERAVFNTGRTAWLRGDCEQAREKWGQALALTPDRMAQLHIADAVYASGDTNGAVTLYKEIDAAKYFYDRGRGVDVRGEAGVATAWYEMSLTISPTRQAAQSLATKYLLANRTEDAIEVWQQIMNTTDAGNADYWWAWGQVAEINRDWNTALESYKQAMPLADNIYFRLSLYVRAGEASQQLKDYSSAKAYFEQAIALYPASITAYLRLGYLEQAQKNYDAALSWYEQADAVYPESELPEYYQGLALWEQGQKDEAQALFEEANEQNPRNASVVFYLGLTAHDRGDLPQAIAYLQHAIELYPATPAGWVRTLGDWYLEAGNCADALAAYQQALDAQPDDLTTQQRIDKAHETCK